MGTPQEKALKGNSPIDRANRNAKKPESVFGKKLGEKLLNKNRGNRPYTKE